MSALKPPAIETEDPGTHELSESSDDHFSSASEGGTPGPQSPVPVTRVERVDSMPSHGEVPGTAAYAQRTQDAVPDEIEIVPEGTRSRSSTHTRASSSGGSPVPKTVVERVDDRLAYGEVQGTAAADMRAADAEPDEVRKVQMSEGRGESDGQDGEVEGEERQNWFRSMWEGGQEGPETHAAEDGEEGHEQDEADDGFGDDFDDFAEGQDGGDDDFGDFDDADQTPLATEPAPTPQAPPTPPNPLADLPPADPTSPSSLSAYLSAIFPQSTQQPPSQPPPTDQQPPPSPFQTPRALSLWQQLLQPPPMSPPNWTRSRIRRLFLVSLGVPVDLDEILPPSKQKRLVLPNINLPNTSSPRQSHTLERVKQTGSAAGSRTSLDSKRAPKSSKRQTLLATPPDVDLNAAALLAATTPEALAGKTDAELKAHKRELEGFVEGATRVLEYWLVRRDEGIREKEALEGVIENLVGFVKGRRGG